MVALTFICLLHFATGCFAQDSPLPENSQSTDPVSAIWHEVRGFDGQKFDLVGFVSIERRHPRIVNFYPFGATRYTFGGDLVIGRALDDHFVSTCARSASLVGQDNPNCLVRISGVYTVTEVFPGFGPTVSLEIYELEHLAEPVKNGVAAGRDPITLLFDQVFESEGLELDFSGIVLSGIMGFELFVIIPPGNSGFNAEPDFISQELREYIASTCTPRSLSSVRYSDRDVCHARFSGVFRVWNLINPGMGPQVDLRLRGITFSNL